MSPAAVIPETVVEIPIELIDESPSNPRHVITQAMVDVLAESIKLEGQKNPAKARPKEGGRYELFAGHIRRLAALKAGLTTLKCLVYDLTPEQAFLEAVLDNRGQQMTWLDDYLVVERRTLLFPDMKQGPMAARLEVAQSTISNAKKLAKLLNQASRDLIYQQLINSAPYQVTQRVAAALGGLATGAPDDAAKVEAALRVAVARQMKEKEAAKLAQWVKAGNKPEDFPQHLPLKRGDKEGVLASEDPLADYWPQLGPGFKVKYKGGETYQVQMNLQGGKETWNAAIAASRALKGAGGGEQAHLPPGPAGADGGATAPAGRSLGEGGLDTPGPTSQGQTGSPLPTFHDLGRSWIQAVGMGEPFPAKGRFGALLAWWFGFFWRNLGWAWKNLPGPLKTEFRLMVRHGLHAVRNPVQFGKGVKGGMGRFLRPVYSAVIQTALRNPTRVLAWGLILVLVWTGYRAAIWGIRGVGWRLLYSQTRLVVPGTHSPSENEQDHGFEASRSEGSMGGSPHGAVVHTGGSPVKASKLESSPQGGTQGASAPNLVVKVAPNSAMAAPAPVVKAKPKSEIVPNQGVNPVVSAPVTATPPTPTQKPQGGDPFGNFLNNVANGAVSGLAGSASNAASNVTSNAVQGIIGH